MTRICAWCGEVMDPGDPADPRVTHGICEACAAAAHGEMAAAAAAHGKGKGGNQWD